MSERIFTMTIRVVARSLTDEELDECGEDSDELVELKDVRVEEIADALQVAAENPEAFAGTGLAVSIVSVDLVRASPGGEI